MFLHFLYKIVFNKMLGDNSVMAQIPNLALIFLVFYLIIIHSIDSLQDHVNLSN